MSLFNDKVNVILEKTRLNANELCSGDVVCNTNPECDHYKSKGVVIKVKPMEDNTGVVGNLVSYIVLNKGDTYNPGDVLDKTEIQLDKLHRAEEEEGSNLTKITNIIQTALDVIGLDPTIGTAADATNAVISVLRAAIAKEPDARKKHLLNAAISLVSVMPLGDVAKLIKLRKGRKLATKGFKAARLYAQKQKSPIKNRFEVTNEQLKPRPKIKPDGIELAKGIKVEMEHTTSKKAAKTIALQHLAEDPNYYTKLEKIEKKH